MVTVLLLLVLWLLESVTYLLRKNLFFTLFVATTSPY